MPDESRRGQRRDEGDGAACPTLVAVDDKPLVTLITSEPGMADRLLAQHVDDGTGRCTVCTGGSQSGRLAWPCQTQMAAAAANAANEADGTPMIHPTRPVPPRPKSGAGAQSLRYRWPGAITLAARAAMTRRDVR